MLHLIGIISIITGIALFIFSGILFFFTGAKDSFFELKKSNIYIPDTEEDEGPVINDLYYDSHVESFKKEREKPKFKMSEEEDVSNMNEDLPLHDEKKGFVETEGNRSEGTQRPDVPLSPHAPMHYETAPLGSDFEEVQLENQRYETAPLKDNEIPPYTAPLNDEASASDLKLTASLEEVEKELDKKFKSYQTALLYDELQDLEFSREKDEEEELSREEESSSKNTYYTAPLK